MYTQLYTFFCHVFTISVVLIHFKLFCSLKVSESQALESCFHIWPHFRWDNIISSCFKSVPTLTTQLSSATMWPPTVTALLKDRKESCSQKCWFGAAQWIQMIITKSSGQKVSECTVNQTTWFNTWFCNTKKSVQKYSDKIQRQGLSWSKGSACKPSVKGTLVLKYKFTGCRHFKIWLECYKKGTVMLFLPNTKIPRLDSQKIHSLVYKWFLQVLVHINPFHARGHMYKCRCLAPSATEGKKNKSRNKQKQQ